MWFLKNDFSKYCKYNFQRYITIRCGAVCSNCSKGEGAVLVFVKKSQLSEKVEKVSVVRRMAFQKMLVVFAIPCKYTQSIEFIRVLCHS